MFSFLKDVKEAISLKPLSFYLTSLGRGFKCLVPQIISIKPLVFKNVKRSRLQLYKPISKILKCLPSSMLNTGHLLSRILVFDGLVVFK